MNTHLSLLVNVIIQKYFLNSRCVIFFSEKFNGVDYVGSIPILQIYVENKSIPQDKIFHYFGCQEIVISNNIPVWTFQTFEKLIRLNFQRFNSRRYLIIPGENPKENLTDIFKTKELTYVSNIVVIEEDNIRDEMESSSKQYIMEKENFTYRLWTHQYVGTKNNNRRIFLDSWSSDSKKFKFNTNLFPNKLLNQKRRRLRMATFQYEPYSIIGSAQNTHRGSEMSVAVAFAKQYNMTPIPVVNAEDYWGEIFTNWSGNGLLGNLALDKADIGFSALYTWAVDYHYLDLSKPLVRTGITCLVPAPRLAARWLTPIFSYSVEIWIFLGILFLVCVLSLFSLHYFNYKSERTRQDPGYLFGYSVFSMIKLFALQAVTQKEIPSGTNGKYFMGLLFVFSLFLTSTYSSGLATVMTLPRYENPINTVEEFVASGLFWGATQDAWISSIQNSEEPMYRKIVERFVPTTEENLREYSKTGKFAFSVERLPHKNFAIGSYIKEDVIGNFRLMQEDFYWEQCLIMTRKNSVLLPLLDQFILRVFESGLIGYWQNEAVTLYMDSEAQRAVRYSHHQNRAIVKLNWSHVQGAFGVLCLGCTMSIFVYILEAILNGIQTNVI